MGTAANRTAWEPYDAAVRRFQSAWGGEGSAAAALDLLETRTGFVQDSVLHAWNEYMPHGGFALTAVGGFGRREQFPHSDVDLLILTERQEPSSGEREHISEFLRTLWDAGLRVSHSVHMPGDCCELNEQNIELAIALLSQRYLAGDAQLHAKLVARLPKFFSAERESLSRNLCRMARGRHAKHGGSIFQQEPDIKEGPGGLRDYHVVCWLEQLRTGHPTAAQGEAELHAAREFLFSLRCWLHIWSGRDLNTLGFDAEEEIASRHGVSAAEWMRHYYSHAREIHRAALRAIEAAECESNNLLAQFRNWRSRVSNADFQVVRERVYLSAPHRLEYEPPLVLKLFEFVARHGLPLASDTERRVKEHAPRLRRFFEASRAPAWPSLASMFSTPNAALALRGMYEAGVLEAVFPEFQAADCLVIRDSYHRYTVDEHTLTAITELERLGSPRTASDPRMSRLYAETSETAVLKFALLFHDLGKAVASGRPHAEESARLAAGAAERVGMPARELRTARALIHLHLELSDAMNRRDMDDPGTLRTTAERVGTIEQLRLLTLLTYADISAVHPGAMTPWRLERLWTVYTSLAAELTRELHSDRVAVEGEQMSFAAGFPKRYLRTHSDEEIVADAELVRRSEERGVAVTLKEGAGFWRLRLAARDRPALLASIAGALSGFGMNILQAEGFANRNGIVLDTFAFTDPHRTLELNPSEVDRLRLTLERVVLGRTDVRSLLRSRPKPARSRNHAIRPALAFDDEASADATLLEVVAEDRPGLLYALASAIQEAGANIELVFVNTQAHRAVDVFYVTREGRKLETGEKDALERLLRKAIELS